MAETAGPLTCSQAPEVATDPLALLADAFAATPAAQSVDPDALGRFHAACSLDPTLGAIEVDEAVLLADLAQHGVIDQLVLTELLLALGQFDVAVRVAEHAYTHHPMDHRVQDSLFRARLYRRDGRIADVPGRELTGRYCPLPWNTLHVLSSGNAHQCCSVWLRTPVGNVFRQSPDEIWTSAEAKQVRAGTLDGSYRHCGKMACPQIRWAAMNDRQDCTVVEDGEAGDAVGDFWLTQPPTLSATPRRLNLSYDRTCNLSCPSCRSERFSARGTELDRIERTTDRILPWLRSAERLEVTGSGDPFASKSFRRLLMAIDPATSPRLRITIMTNGLLLDRREWQRFAHLHGMIDAINVSVDAANAGTYRTVRRGGELADLVPNLHFIGELLATGAIANFRMCFVVQQRNFREMPDFVRMAAAAGASQVRFQMLHDWGSMATAELHAQRIHVESHPEHGEFLTMLDSLSRIDRPQILSDFGYLLGQDAAMTA